MKAVRFQVSGRETQGVLKGDLVWETDAPFSLTATNRDPYPLSAVPLLPPCIPSKIIAVGLNYRDHAEELGLPAPDEPIIFLKPPTTILGPGEAIRFPPMSNRVDYEAELGIVIRDRIRCMSPDDARRHIFGYTCANDVTARDLQKKDGQWSRAKSFDTFCPIGPWIETELNPDDLLVESYLNGAKRQSSRTSRFIFPVDTIVSFISCIMTLLPGDLIITGTPSGIGPMQPGDEIEVRIEGIGSLMNRVV